MVVSVVLVVVQYFRCFYCLGRKAYFWGHTKCRILYLITSVKTWEFLFGNTCVLGGFSAVISMVIVSTLALSTMVSNNLIIPYGFLDKFIKNQPERNSKYIKNIRRISIFTIIITAYFFYVSFSKELSLYAIGLISFVIISQLAPSFL